MILFRSSNIAIKPSLVLSVTEGKDCSQAPDDVPVKVEAPNVVPVKAEAPGVVPVEAKATGVVPVEARAGAPEDAAPSEDTSPMAVEVKIDPEKITEKKILRIDFMIFFEKCVIYEKIARKS